MSRTGQARNATLAVAVCLASPVQAQRHLWDPESRVVVTDAGTVVALAAGTREVFAATPRQILIRDLMADTWRLPIPLPADAARSGPTSLAWDTRTGGLWLGTEAGDLYSVTPGIWQWDRIPAAAAGPIDAIVDAGRDAFVYYRSRGQWRRLPGGSSFPEAVPTTGVPDAVLRAADGAASDPFLRAAAGTLGLDARQRSWRITDTKPGPDPGVFWVGTAGGGIVRFDSRAGARGWFRFGTQAAGTASIARIDDLVWFGGNGAGPHDGVATTTPDLGKWQQFDSGDGAPRGFVAEIVEGFDRIWFASSDGLFSLPASVATEGIRSAAGPPGGGLYGRTDRGPGSRPAWSRLTSSDGLPSDQVRSLARAGDLLWVGTERGAVALDAAGHVTTRILSGSRVSRMAVSANSLLLATDAGLYRVGIDDMAGEPTRIADPAVTARVTDVVATTEGPFVVVDGLVRRSGPGAPTVRDAALDRIGPALRLAWADGRLWVAGPRGIAVMEASTGRWVAFTVPDDLPAGPVTDVVPSGDEVWAATPAGAIRLRWH